MRDCWDGGDRAALPLAEGVLLWSMRVWVVGLRQPGGVLDRIASAFADLGAPAAADYLDGFMWALRHGAQRTIGVECPCNRGLDRDERALLDVFALAQHGQGFEATLMLRSIVAPGAVGAMIDSAERLGAVVRGGGRVLVLPERPALAQFGFWGGAGTMH